MAQTRQFSPFLIEHSTRRDNMPRRSAVPENGTTARVKEERVRVKDEKARKPAPIEEASQDQEQSQELEMNEDANGEQDDGEEEDVEGASPRGNKRRRVNGNGDSAPGEASSSQPTLPRVKTLPRGDDG